MSVQQLSPGASAQAAQSQGPTPSQQQLQNAQSQQQLQNAQQNIQQAAQNILGGLSQWMPSQSNFFGVGRQVDPNFWKNQVEKQRMDEFISKCKEITKEKK